MEIHQLKTFVAVAREGSITRASERLYLSQPAVSAHIKAIEETLGLTLFERTPRGMSVTGDGQRLLVKAELALAAHRELIDEATRLKGRLTGRLRLGAAGNSSTAALGRFLTVLSERCPEVEVALRHGTSFEVLHGILSGRTGSTMRQHTPWITEGAAQPGAEPAQKACCSTTGRGSARAGAPAGRSTAESSVRRGPSDRLPGAPPVPLP